MQINLKRKKTKKGQFWHFYAVLCSKTGNEALKIAPKTFSIPF